ncbi:MAG TPA: hypothetical protein VEQ59_20270 [Polyangiaceae bacterium]|nr:hypothetical protein [Polyangiaceae bacterium]
MAGLFALGILVGAAPAHADVKITDAARQHFNAGVSLLKDPDGARYEDAYREFKAAYEASPSWKILGNLGLTAMKLERDGEAIDAYTRYLAEGKKDIDPSERADIERDLGTLRASAVTLVISTAPESVVVTDERTPVTGSPVRNRYQSQAGSLRLQVRPGHHLLTASNEGKSLSFELDAEPGSTREHTFDFNAPVAVAAPPVVEAPPPAAAPPPPPPPTRPIPTGVWVGVAATGAFAVGAGVVGVMALGKNSDFNAANGHDAAKAKSLQSDTQTLNVVTDVLIGAALVSAGVTTYLYVKRPTRDSSLSALRVSPRAGVNQGGLYLEGAF